MPTLAALVAILHAILLGGCQRVHGRGSCTDARLVARLSFPSTPGHDGCCQPTGAHRGARALRTGSVPYPLHSSCVRDYGKGAIQGPWLYALFISLFPPSIMIYCSSALSDAVKQCQRNDPLAAGPVRTGQQKCIERKYYLHPRVIDTSVMHNLLDGNSESRRPVA